MRPITYLSGLLFVAASLPAQSHLMLPATAAPAFELNSYSLLPFMQPNARVQMFYDATETGSTAFVADQLALRYDGPIPQVGAPGPFAIVRLQINIGVTAILAPNADFAGNLTQPLTNVFDGPWSYLPDNGSAAPHPWGGPNNTLIFPFTTTVPITLVQDQWLVVELIMEGNNIASFGFAHAILDGATTTGGISGGSTAPAGQGCSAGPGLPDATASTTGIHAPGAAHFLTGTNLGANALAVAVYGLGNPMAPVPSTNCTLYANPDLTALGLTDASGAIAGAQAFVLSLPASSVISGVSVFEQVVSLVPGANPFGLVFSNGVTVTLGSYSAPGRGTWVVAHDAAAGAPFANTLQPFGYALRLRTL